MRSILSPRQQEILVWMGRGKTNPEIGIILGICEETVKNQIQKILEKLGTPNRVCAVVEAIRRGLIILDMNQGQVQAGCMQTVSIAPEPAPKAIFSLDGLTVFDNHTVDVGITPPPRRDVIHKRPFGILRFLADPLGRVHTRQEILDEVWGKDVFVEERTVDMHVTRLRKILNGCPYAVKAEINRGFQLIHL